MANEEGHFIDPIVLEPLRTARLVLAPISKADISWLQVLMEIPSVNLNTLIIPSPCPADFASDWVEAAIANNISGKAYTFSISLEKDHRPIGAIFLLNNAAHNHAELGYFLDPAYWSKGFCSEAAAEMLQFAFKRLGLNRVFAVYFSSNPASGKVMKKIGMVHEGCRRKHIRKCGTFHDIEQYGLLFDEWMR